MKDDEIMLIALSKERELLHEQLLHIDRVIKKIKTGEYFGSGDVIRLDVTPKSIPQRIAFPKHTDTKVIVLKAMDNLGQVASLRQIQEEYNKLSGNTMNIREAVRSLNNSKLVLLMKEKNGQRGSFWLKKEWLNNGILLDEHKPEGFDLLYKSDNIVFV